MIPILFDSTETDFTTYGKGKLADALSCVIHETLAGDYELEMEYPVTGALFSDLLDGGIIWADNKAYSHSANNAASNRPHTTQPFDIYKISEAINGVVTVYARHVFYRLGNGAIFEPSYSAFQYIPWWINYALVNATPAITDFSVTVVSGGSSVGNVITNEDLFSSEVAFTPLQMIFGEGMALDISGAEIICSGFELFLYSRRGGDYGASIRYGKNMVGFKREIDGTETFNAAVPFWAEDGAVVQGGLVQPTTPITPVKAKPLDLSSSFSSAPTAAQLTSVAQTWLDNNTPWVERDTIDVDMAVVNDLDAASIELGDDVRVYYEDYGVNIIQRVVEYWYDVIEENYQTLRIGTEQTEFVAVTGDTVSASSAGASGGGSGGGVPAYQPGDTLTLNSYAPFDGLITSSTKSVRFCIPTPKSMANITTITATNLSAELRGAKGYLNSQSGFYDYADRSGYTVTCTKVTDTLFRVNIDKSTAFSNVDNNTLVNALLEATAAFEFQ